MSGSAPNPPRSFIALLAMLALLAGCAGPAGDGGSESGDSGTSTDAADSGDSGDSADSGDSDESNGVVDPCTLIPDAALEAALGGPIAAERETYHQSSSTLCRIQTTASPPAILSVDLSATGRDGFEVSRGYKDDIPDLYQELPGVGEDAFAFGHEVTMLKGRFFVVIFLEGLPFDNVSEADKLERAKTLALAAAEELPD